MKICFTLTNLELGGAQIFALRMASAFADSTEHNVFLYDHNPEYMQKGITDNLSSRVKVLSFCKSPFLRFWVWKINGLILKLGFKFEFRHWLNRKMFLRDMRKYRMNIINSHMSASDYEVARIKDKLNFCFVSTMHGEYEMSPDSPNDVSRNIPLTISKMDAIIYTADKNLKSIQHLLTKQPIEKIYLGFSDKGLQLAKRSRNELGIGPSAFVIGMFARGLKEKGWEEAIAAFSEARTIATGHDMHLVLMGTGSYLKQLCETIAAENVHLLQLEKNPLDCFSYIDLFDITTLPSYFEGESVPNSVVESLYWKKPVIATNIGDVPKMIEYNGEQAGIVVEFINGKADTKAMTQGILRYIEQPGFLKGQQELAGKAFEKFRLEQLLEKYNKLFNDVLKK